MATKERVLTGVRWSSAVRCPRRATYEHLDAPKAEPTAEEERRWKRGRVWEAAVKADVAAQLREQGKRIRTEVEIPWPAGDPIGTGHADIVVPSQGRHVVEVTSNMDGDVIAEKCLQGAGYSLNLPGSEGASLIVVNTHTGADTVVPINVAGLEPQVREIEETVVKSVRDGELPCRVCRTPFDGPAQMCPFAETVCFDGYDWRTPRDELIADAAVFERLVDAEEEYKAAKKRQDDADAERKRLRAEVAQLVPVGERVSVGGVDVNRTAFDKHSFSLSDAKKAGFTLPPALEAFVKTIHQERWDIKRRSS